MSSSNAISASLTIQTIRVQPTTAAGAGAAAAAAEATATATTTTAIATLSPAAFVKTQELSGVWCPLLMTLANNSFCASANNKKPFAFNGNSRVLHKPQIQYCAAKNNKNNCYTTEPTIYQLKQQQQQQQQKRHHLHHYHAHCCCPRYRQITSGLCAPINPQITKPIKDSTNNLNVYREMDTTSTTRTTITNKHFFAYNLQKLLPFIILKPNPNSLLLLTISHESLLHYVPPKEGLIDP